LCKKNTSQAHERTPITRENLRHSQNVLVFNVSGGLSLVGQACGKLKRGSKVSKFFWQAKKFPHLAIPELPEKTDLRFEPERYRFCSAG
jgi:hypothetical protein